MRRLDYKEQLVDYFKKNLSKNYNHDTLKFAIVSQGYSRVAVDQAYERAVKEMSDAAPVLKEKPVIKYQVYDLKDNPIHVEPMNFWEKVRNWFKGRNFD